jgi:DNA-binding transcriptional MerR regulator
MSEVYSVGQLTVIAKVAPQTVHRWCDVFSAYLSQGATPSKGRKRVFTQDDMSVLLYVATAKNGGATYEEISAALANGQRVELPDAIPSESAALALQVSRQDVETALHTELAVANERVSTLTRLLSNSEDKVETLEGEIRRLHKEIGRLEAQLEAARGK